jgi:hypothetical protein
MFFIYFFNVALVYAKPHSSFPCFKLDIGSSQDVLLEATVIHFWLSVSNSVPWAVKHRDDELKINVGK